MITDDIHQGYDSHYRCKVKRDEAKERKAIRTKMLAASYRLIVYKYMLKTMKWHTNSCYEARTGFCISFPPEFGVFIYWYRLRMCPELLKYKPKKNAEKGWWFSRYDSIVRIKILETIISEMESNIV